MKLPRILIVSVNPLSDTSNNGKTYASFFRGYPSDRIAQLYFHREMPDSPVCSQYFRISDDDIAAALIHQTWRLGPRPQGWQDPCSGQSYLLPVVGVQNGLWISRRI